MRNLLFKRHRDGKLERKERGKKVSEVKSLEIEQRKGKEGNSQIIQENFPELKV